MNKLGISIGYKNCEMIPEYAAAGFEVMEISLPAVSVEDQRKLGERAMELAKECGIELWSVHIPFHPTLDISAPDEDKRRKAIELLMPSVEMAKEWGAQVAVVHGSSEPNEDSSRGARIIACAKSLKELQAACGSIRSCRNGSHFTCVVHSNNVRITRCPRHRLVLRVSRVHRRRELKDISRIQRSFSPIKRNPGDIRLISDRHGLR